MSQIMLGRPAFWMLVLLGSVAGCGGAVSELDSEEATDFQEDGVSSRSVRIHQSSPAQLRARPADSIRITYNWSGGPTSKSLINFIHFVTEGGANAFQDDHWPSVPTNQWNGGARAEDREYVVPSDAPAGTYRVFAGLYDGGPGGSGARLKLKKGPGVTSDTTEPRRYLIGTVVIEHVSDPPPPPPPPPPPLPTCASGGIAGTGTGLSAVDQEKLTANLERISSGWDQPSVDSANAIFSRSQYSAGDWERFFDRYFNQTGHAYTDGLFGFLGYPVYFWLESAARVKLQTGLVCPLLQRSSRLIAARPSDLGAALKADGGLRSDLMNIHRMLDDLGVHGEIGAPVRDIVYGEYKGLIAGYPQYFRAAATLSTSAQPFVAALRAQVWMSFRDSRPLTAAGKNDVAESLGLGGRHLDIWNATSTLVHDNNGFDAAQKDVVLALLTSVPSALLDLGNITQHDLLGNAGASHLLLKSRSGVNIFNTRVGQTSENSFPSDVSPGVIDLFSVALAHEVNHVVDLLYVEKNPTLKARKARLLAQAGTIDMQYLRSMVGGASFQQYPQELFASISNQWFADSGHTLALGMKRFDAGYREPLNQALFFAEVYAVGGASTSFYRIDTSGRIALQAVPVSRDAAGRITGLTYGGRQHTFSLDADGNVQSYRVQ